MIFKGFSNTHKQYLNIIFSPFRILKYEDTMKPFPKMQCCPLTTFLQKCAPQMVSVKNRCHSNKYPKGSKLWMVTKPIITRTISEIIMQGMEQFVALG